MWVLFVMLSLDSMEMSFLTVLLHVNVCGARWDANVKSAKGVTFVRENLLMQWEREEGGSQARYSYRGLVK
jgi:hypothetical protein